LSYDADYAAAAAVTPATPRRIDATLLLPEARYATTFAIFAFEMPVDAVKHAARPVIAPSRHAPSPALWLRAVKDMQRRAPCAVMAFFSVRCLQQAETRREAVNALARYAAALIRARVVLMPICAFAAAAFGAPVRRYVYVPAPLLIRRRLPPMLSSARCALPLSVAAMPLPLASAASTHAILMITTAAIFDAAVYLLTPPFSPPLPSSPPPLFCATRRRRQPCRRR
jgi:hypothetical protein